VTHTAGHIWWVKSLGETVYAMSLLHVGLSEGHPKTHVVMLYPTLDTPHHWLLYVPLHTIKYLHTIHICKCRWSKVDFPDIGSGMPHFWSYIG
jgi:hypothetical protein